MKLLIAFLLLGVVTAVGQIVKRTGATLDTTGIVLVDGIAFVAIVLLLLYIVEGIRDWRKG